MDYDNDGDEDLYVVSGYLKPHSILFQPNVLLRNELDGTFTNVSFGSGADSVGIGRGGVYLDFDNDGCLDLFVVNYEEDARLYRNLCEWGNNWLRVKTVGTRSNRDGIGARIKISAGGVSQIREIRAGSSSMGQNTSMAHFGLGTHEIVETIEIIWPSGIVQKISDVAINQILQVTEPTP